MSKKVYSRQEVEAAIPKARQLAAARQGKPVHYTEQDIVNAFYNYINGYNVDPIDKEQMLSQDNLRWALEYLNGFGHSPKHLQWVVESMYNTPRNKRQQDAQQRNAKKNKNNREDGYSGLGRNLLKFATGVVDVPRRALASFLHHGTEDGRYDTGQILDVMDERPTPLTGLGFAQNHPVISAGVDILTPTLLASAASAAVNTTKNALSYAGRKQLTGFQKSSALQQMQNGTVPDGTEYEVIRTLKPTTSRSNATHSYEWNRAGGSKLTGTASPATGTPYTRGSVVNGAGVRGQQVVTPGYKAVDDVYTWASYPWYPFFLPGVPQFVPTAQTVQSAGNQPEPPYTIVEEIPQSYDDSDIINALGAQEGDIIHMPDGRVIQYTKGGDSRGTQHDYTTVREYDRHNRDVKKQPNVPDRTRTENRKGDGKKVSVEQRRNPDYMHRDYNNYYPEIVPINNGKNYR